MVNETTAKASLTQMLVIVFRRMEADSSTVPLQPIVVADLMEPADKSSSDVNNTVFVQNFISKIMQDIDVVLNPSPLKSIGGHDGAFDSTAVGTMNPTDLLDSTDKDMLDAKYWEISMARPLWKAERESWLMGIWNGTEIWKLKSAISFDEMCFWFSGHCVISQ